jgi:hypothetical protein
MFQKVSLWAAFAATMLLASRAAAQTAPPANRLLPQNTVLAVELSKPKALLDVVLGEKAIQAVTSTPLFRQVIENPSLKQAIQVVRYLELRLGVDWKTGLHKLVDGGIVWAVTADGGNLLIVEAQDAKILGQLHEVVLEFTKNDAANSAKPGQMASSDYRGVKAWSLFPNEAHAIVGNRLVLASRRELLKTILDLNAGEGKGLTESGGYQAAQRSVGGDGVATAYVNLAAIKLIPGIQKALTEEANPMGALLLAGVRETLRESNWLAMQLRVDDRKLTLSAKVDGRPNPAAEQAAFAWPKLPDEGALPNVAVPRLIAGLSFYRDLHGFYAAKDKLFPERTSGLIFFENMMGIFFSGRDLTEDIMAQPKPQVRMVVAEQVYDKAIGTPQVQIPAFAAILRLNDPAKYADVAEGAWQKALGLVNVTRGQKAEPGLIIDRLSHSDTRYTVAYFPASDEKKGPVGMEHNFRPTLVKMGEYVVLSSTDGLAKDVIDALKKEIADKVKPLAGVHSLIEFNASQLSSILGANRQTLVRQNMVEKGATREQAEATIGMLTTLVGYLGEFKLSVGVDKSAQQATLEFKPAVLR